ncbi:type III-B CRISPR module-associated protein Cmr5 [Sulfolobus sp. S-194]|uniref:type III-B CRISPR module-associated protein Cmr5 n=1 Tax=Sulfolobus sp. S-194 TaxID=2512240 RepID=UPI0014372D42|nr:type III-B CRISPR module-associated protein Cmr5 [Sulfolobus sp. S-194]QIW22853.1 type III-B CRISPR module-associated protein Cmr5 [Sulfolobus sp. S-194]
MDYIDYVIEYGKKLESKKLQCKNIDAFVRRAEDFPSLVAQEGLVPAMTFYYAKAEGKVNNLESAECDEVENEGKGYSVYLMFLTDVLNKFGNIKCNNSLECIKEVRKNELIITRKILPILIEMKKVAKMID